MEGPVAKFILSITASLLLLWAGESLAASVTIGSGTGSTTAAVKNSALAGTEAGLVVRCASGCSGAGGGDGTLLDGVDGAIKATVKDYTNSNPLAIIPVDTNGDPASLSGGTQYDQGTVATATDKLSMLGCRRVDTAAVDAGVAAGDRSGCIVSANGSFWIANTNMESYLSRLLSSAITSPSGGAAAATTGFIVGGRYLSTPPTLTNGQEVGLMFSSAGRLNVDAGTVTVASHAVTNAGTFATQATLQTGANVIGALTANQSVNVAQVNGVTPLMGNGASGTGAQRVTIANDSTGTIIATQATGTNLHVVCDSGCSGSGGTSAADNSAVTFGTTALTPSGFVFDDVSPNAVTENRVAIPRMSANRNIYGTIRDAAGNERGANVNASNELNTSANTELPAAAALADATANPTVPGVGSYSMCWNGTTWDRCSKATAGAGVVDSGTQRITWASDAPGIKAEDSAHTTADPGMVTLTKRTDTAATSAGTDGDYATLNTDATGRVWANTELPDAAALADATSNPTTTGVASYNMCFNGTTWDRCLKGAAGNGTTDSSTQRVTISSDSTGTVIATSATAANLLNRPDTSGATGAAPPARANYIGGLGSGATGGFLIGPAVADTFKPISVTSATTTLLVTGVSGRHVRITSINLLSAIANNVALISGTGATCGTGTTGMAGGTTAANGWNFAANGGLAFGNGLGTVLQTGATGDSVCVITSAAGPLAGTLGYAIY